MMALHQQLEAALQNPEQFAARAKEAEQLKTPELIALATAFYGRKPRSRRQALDFLWRRHEALMSIVYRARATVGRSAA